MENNSTVTIGAETPEDSNPAPTIAGNVFGAGAGLETHGYSALLRGNTAVTIQGNARVGLNVFGGGEIASVGKFVVAGGIPTTPDGGGDCIVNVRGGAIIGTNTDSNITNKGHVFGAGQGVEPHKYTDVESYSNISDMPRRMMAKSMGTFNESNQDYWQYVSNDDPNNVWEYLNTKQKYLDFLPTLALASHPVVTIGGASNAGTITPSGTPAVNGSVYGGGQRGITMGTVAVNIVGGTVGTIDNGSLKAGTGDVYGGGALADTNKGNWDATANSGAGYWASNKTSATYTTTVNLTGGTIKGTAYGGGLGSKPTLLVHNAENVPAYVYGDVLVKLNESDGNDCKVLKIHGCNNQNGTPKGDVTVHVYRTVPFDDETHLKSVGKNNTTFDMDAVYGGGNEAAYNPEDANHTRKAHVIIDGCDLTSIETVYGGGNAASAPATFVEVNGCYEIGTVFGGGNGLNDLSDGKKNPGAHVGYLPAVYTYDYTKTPAENAVLEAAAFEAQKTTLGYGSGEALAELHGGTIHKAFGGSNTLGNVRVSSKVNLDETDHASCPLCVEEVYGAGNNADQDGSSNIDLGCMEFLADMYGGAKNADVNSNIVLNIQSGRFNRVFGGNNLGGCVRGSITVNIEETGCHPIIIGQLFGGGNQAGYSVYGYKQVGGEWVPREESDGLETGTTPYADPKVDVKSFTSIGEIYGGGYGASAVIVGNTNVIINECIGLHASDDINTYLKDQNGEYVLDENNQRIQVSDNTGQWIHFVAGKNSDNTDKITTVWQPEHKSGEIGTIGNVFGGGNEAPVHGNTNVLIGQLETVLFETPTTKIVTVPVTDPDTGNPVTDSDTGEAVTTQVVQPTTDTDRTHTVIGVNITGNVYGGGNAADVTGNTNVVIGNQ